MPVIKAILAHQAARSEPLGLEAAPHKPEVLLIGCVDARTDPIRDLGIPKGKALILRNVAALVHPKHKDRLTESAALEFAVRAMHVKHICIMGHTDCGGIKAALGGSDYDSLNAYLDPLSDLASKYNDPSELEEAAVKYSLDNLLSYDYIAEAVDKGELQLHGWVMDTASGRIRIYHHENDAFEALNAV